jgi:hypothetical protein
MFKSVLNRFSSKRAPRPFTEFIPFKETLAAATAAGISVGEYIERRHTTGAKLALDETINGMASFGLFSAPIDTVCEIGTGSGRYLDRTIARCKPRVYEIYETSKEWKDWVVERYGVKANDCDGRTLSQTESGSVDLVQAHKVFPGAPFLCTVSYFREMARVVRDGGWVVFDIMTENCFKPEYLEKWFAANPWQWEWSPRMTAREFAVEMFAERGVDLVGSFLVPNYPAVTECMVFRKTPLKNDQLPAK